MQSPTLFRTICFHVTVVALIAAPLFAHAASNPWGVSSRDITLLEQASNAASAERWNELDGLAKRASDRTVRDAITWLSLYYGEAEDFNDAQAFLERHQNWPGYERSLRQAELLLNNVQVDQGLLQWFNNHPPLSARGMQAFAEATLMSRNVSDQTKNQMTDLLRQAWINGNFIPKDEAEFLDKHYKLLRQEDHNNRLSRLLWNDRVEQAMRMLSKVDGNHQKLALARIALIKDAPNIDQAIRNVPFSLRNDPGLTFNRIQWRHHKGKESEVIHSLLSLKTKEFSELVWPLRNYYAREAIEQKRYHQAYSLASNHGTTAGTSFADAEWLSGFLALRFLNQPKVALNHFLALYQGVQYPISRSRAAYWAGRAAEALRNKELANSWYQRAAVVGDRYYGQLAYHKLYPNQDLRLPSTPEPTSLQLQQSLQNPLIKVAYLFHLANADKYGRLFIEQAVETAKTPESKVAVVKALSGLKDPEVMVIGSKYLSQDGIILSKEGYPILNQVPGSLEQKALSHAIIRQESEFKSSARSKVGARGYMQLMPDTADRMAKKLKLSYSKRQIASDPNVNIMLGSAYLKHLIENYDGNYVLAIAAYNAGPGNAKKWVRNFGDPRHVTSTDEAIDWVELIPYNETRNYVQRVLENLQIYRAKFGNTTSGSKAILVRDLDQKAAKERLANL